ncbi:Holliday junction resolvase RecU [Mycoplasma sp. P36-A1]|uniref:Holliday junction resolvase RecU n=1 Tax=Mycoplasma sp. P36-A1 TaxID=3252900 RepID=UPI003C2B1EED
MIKYPNGKNFRAVHKDSKKSASNRGMTLEKDLDSTNKFYLAQEIANIHKKPTPIQVVSVDYPQRSKARITEAYYKTPSTTDYNGVYKGFYIDFEAKETRNSTIFKFANIHQHQFNHLESVIKHGGIAFFIIRFIPFDEIYVIDAKIIIKARNDGHKSLQYDIIKANGYIVSQKYNPRIDYLQCVDNIINKEVSKFE